MQLNFLEKKTGNLVTKTSFLDTIITSISGYLIILTHFVGPFLAFLDFVKNKIFKTKIIKLKTER